MKSGWKTSEFWVTLGVHVTGAALVILGQVEAQWAVGASAVAQAVYTWSRAHVKGAEQVSKTKVEVREAD